MKHILIILISTNFLISQNNLFIKINKAIKEDDLHLIYKNFKDKYVFNVFERDFAGKTNLVFNVINDKQINDRHIIKTELVEINEKSEKKLMKINFYTETIKDFDYIYSISYDGQIDKKTDSILAINFLNKNIDLPYRENQTEKNSKLDSLGHTIIEAFKKDKNSFLNKYFLPKNCDNSVGDNWAARDYDGKKELNNVEFNFSNFDKNINAGTITLTLYFDNNNYSEQDILYFKFIKNTFQYFYTSQNFNLIKFLE
jgi:hypothetical protein